MAGVYQRVTRSLAATLRVEEDTQEDSSSEDSDHLHKGEQGQQEIVESPPQGKMEN